MAVPSTPAGIGLTTSEALTTSSLMAETLTSAKETLLKLLATESSEEVPTSSTLAAIQALDSATMLHPQETSSVAFPMEEAFLALLTIPALATPAIHSGHLAIGSPQVR